MSNLSEHNQDMCKTLDPDLTAVLDDASAEIGFHIVQALRTQAEQTANLARGVSQTRDSLHLADARGLARAADLAALVEGKIAWKPETLYYAIAEAVRKAAIKRNVNVRWGGCWRVLGADTLNRTCAQLVADYTQECRMLRKSGFYDFGHFEIRK